MWRFASVSVTFALGNSFLRLQPSRDIIVLLVNLPGLIPGIYINGNYRAYLCCRVSALSVSNCILLVVNYVSVCLSVISPYVYI